MDAVGREGMEGEKTEEGREGARVGVRRAGGGTWVGNGVRPSGRGSGVRRLEARCRAVRRMAGRCREGGRGVGLAGGALRTDSGHGEGIRGAGRTMRFPGGAAAGRGAFGELASGPEVHHLLEPVEHAADLGAEEDLGEGEDEAGDEVLGEGQAESGREVRGGCGGGRGLFAGGGHLLVIYRV